MKITFSALVFALSLAAAPAFSQEFQAKATSYSPASAELVWSATSHDFGAIPKGTPVKAVFTVKNTTDQTLLLKEVKASCGCTATGYSQAPIAPGASTEITATYNAASPGVFTKNITVRTNLSETPTILKIQGIVE